MIATDSLGSFVVDLIGDLDATLGTILGTTLDELRAGGATDVFITTKHVTLASSDGLAALDRALEVARNAGVEIGLEAGSRKMRAAFVEARIPIAKHLAARGSSASRHFMIAHHAKTRALRPPADTLSLSA